MLPKKKRVTKDLFQMIMKNGRIIQSPLFVFKYVAQKAPQYAFVAPKSVAKGAVERTLLRRKGYNALKTKDIIPLAGIFFYKKQAKNATFQEISGDIESVLRKISL